MALVLFFALPFYAKASEADRPAVVSSVQTTNTTDSSSIVIVLTGEPEYRFNPTTAPLTLQVDLGRTVLSPVLPQFLPVNDGRVKGVEAFQYKADSAKVTIGLEPGMDYSVSFKRSSGFAIVIDVFARGSKEGAGKAP